MKRLLLLFAVMLGVMVNGAGVYAQERIIYYTVGVVSNEGEGDGTIRIPIKYSTLSQIIDDVNEKTANDSIVIVLPGGEYDGFLLKKDRVLIEGEKGQTILKGGKIISEQPTVVEIASTSVTLKNLIFRKKEDVTNNSSGLFFGKGKVTVDSCDFNDLTLSKGIYSEPSVEMGDDVIISNCAFGVSDRNILISDKSHKSVIIKNNIFKGGVISLNPSTSKEFQVLENEFSDCKLNLPSSILFKRNKIYPVEGKSVYSTRNYSPETAFDLSENYWGSENPDFSKLIDATQTPQSLIKLAPYYTNKEFSVTGVDCYVSSTEGLVSVVKYVPEGSIVKVLAGTYLLSSSLVLDKDISIIGAVDNGVVIKADANFSATSVSGSAMGSNYLVNIKKGNVKLESLKIASNKKEGFGGINTWGATVALSNVTIENSGSLALEVSKNAFVTAKGIVLTGNGAGINVSLEDQLGNGRNSFTLLDDSRNSFGPAEVVYAQGVDCENVKNGLIVITLPEKWKMFTVPTLLIWKISDVPNVVNGQIVITPNGTKKENGDLLKEAIAYAAYLNPIPEIVLKAGTYEGNFVIMEGVNVTGTFANGDSTILDGGGIGRVVSQKDLTAKYTGDWQNTYAFGKETVWKNLIIKNGKLTNEYKAVYGAGAGIFLSKNGILQNCIVRDNKTEGSGLKAAGVLLDTGGALDNCIIENNKACDSYAGVMILGDGIVRNCVIRHNEITTTEHTAGIGHRAYTNKSAPDRATFAVLIDGCNIYQNQTNGTNDGAAGVTLNNTIGTVEIRNSKIHNNYDKVAGSLSGMRTGYSDSGIFVTNCLIYNNGKILDSGNATQNGLVVGSGTKILNSTIWDNVGSHSGIYAIESGNPVITTINTITQDYYGKSSNSDSYSASHHIIKNSLLLQTREGLVGESSIIGATTKLFADSLKGNYSPALGAPYIDKGTIGNWKATDKDLAGVSRIQGSNIDMGAYESSLSADLKPVKITSVPDVITFGDTIRLLSNYKNVKYEFANGTGNGVLKWEISKSGDTSIVAIKPGSETLKVSTTMEQENISSILPVTVEKKMISVNTSCLSVDDINYGVTYTGGINNSVSGDVNVLFAGLVKEHLAVSLKDLKGINLSTNAGDQIPVAVTATLDGADASYYTLAPINHITMKIKKKVLTVTADAKKRDFGNPNPDFTVTCSEFAEGGGVRVLGGELKFVCTATIDSVSKDKGYDIVPYGYNSSNYDIQYKSGILTINPVDPKVELISAVVDQTTKNKVTLTGRLIHTGGAKAGTIVNVGFMQGSTTLTSVPATLTEAGLFTLTTDALNNATYEFKATAKISTGGVIASASQSITINKEFTLQTINFAGLSDKIEYGTAPLTLSATSNQSTATGDYTFKVESGKDIVKIEGTTLSILKAGTAAISVSRPADNTKQFTAASALFSLEVAKKPVRIVNKSDISKIYNATLDAPVSLANLKVVDVAGENMSGLSLKGSISGKFADKNVGDKKKIVISGVALSDKDNYDLLGYDVTGNITPTGLSINIVDAKRKYNETRPTYRLVYTGFQGTDTEDTPGLHTGTIAVREDNNNILSVVTDDVSFPNYAFTAGTAVVEIEKGTPKVVTYSDGSKVLGVVVDEAGWKVTKGNDTEINDNKQAFATYTDNSGNIQTIYGTPLSGSNSVELQFGSPQTRAINPEFNMYGQKMSITFSKGVSLESTDPKVLKILEITEFGDKGTATIEAVGIGSAAIVVIANDYAGANLLEATIKPRPISISSSAITKEYDGTNAANGILLIATGLLPGDDVSLSYGSFMYPGKDVATAADLQPSRTIQLVGTKSANYEIGQLDLKGTITQKELDVKAVTKEYNGTSTDKNVIAYQADGLIEEDLVPLNVDWGNGNVDAGSYSGITVTLPINSNYKLKITGTSTITGTISQAKILASVGALEVTDATVNALKSALKQADFFTLAATGEQFSIKDLNGYEPTITVNNGVYTISGGDTKNYSFIYVNNSGTYTIKSSGGDPAPSIILVESITLDKTVFTLPRLGTYILKATINPDNATNKNVSWKSSDDKIVKVDSNGKVTAFAVGKATITVTAEDNNKAATCEVIVDFATSMEEAIANTIVYGKEGCICILPIAPMQVEVVSMLGKQVYNGKIASTVQIPLIKGIYLVKLGTGNEILVKKVSVR